MKERIFSTYTWLIPELYKRYTDDIFGAASCRREELEDFITHVFTFHSALQFTRIISQTQLPFLEITLSISDSRISTSVYYKDTDTHNYLHYISSHPQHCKTGPRVVTRNFRMSTSQLPYLPVHKRPTSMYVDQSSTTICEHFTCKLENVVYCISCRRCRQLYIEETRVVPYVNDSAKIFEASKITLVVSRSQDTLTLPGTLYLTTWCEV